MSVVNLPRVRKATAPVDATKSLEWLKANRKAFVGKWVVLDGDRLVGAGDDPIPIVAQARAQGISSPFVQFIRGESDHFWGGWL